MVPFVPNFDRSDVETLEYQERRFRDIDRLSRLVISGVGTSMILTGPAGVGKSFGVEKALEEYDPAMRCCSIVKGYVRPTGLFKLLYEHRFSGQVLVLDDADSVLKDLISINLLKAALDTKKVRTVTYNSMAKIVDDRGRAVPKTFDFAGSVIFISNIDFERAIERGDSLSPHLEALMSRAIYVNLRMEDKREYYIRMLQVIESGLFDDEGLDAAAQLEVLSFLDSNYDKMREVSIRQVQKLASFRREASDWRSLAETTMLVA